ncbi:MAG: hypothetical protein RLZZ387_3689 [Chloroflexota bacterium]|jgi:hypothetical protein
MSELFNRRYTAQTDGPFVVFLIGVRFNRLRAMCRWLPVAQAMRPMLQTLYAHPEKGFLDGSTWLGWRSVLLVQYWRSFEDLERFARSPSDPHRDAWRRFNQSVGSDGTVGIWHETYLIEPERHEAIHGNMPRVGLAAALGHSPVTAGRTAARERLRGEEVGV